MVIFCGLPINFVYERFLIHMNSRQIVCPYLLQQQLWIGLCRAWNAFTIGKQNNDRGEVSLKTGLKLPSWYGVQIKSKKSIAYKMELVCHKINTL